MFPILLSLSLHSYSPPRFPLVALYENNQHTTMQTRIERNMTSAIRHDEASYMMTPWTPPSTTEWNNIRTGRLFCCGMRETTQFNYDVALFINASVHYASDNYAVYNKWMKSKKPWGSEGDQLLLSPLNLEMAHLVITCLYYPSLITPWVCIRTKSVVHRKIRTLRESSRGWGWIVFV